MQGSALRSILPLSLLGACQADAADTYNPMQDCCRDRHLKIGLPPITYDPLWTFDTEVAAAAAAAAAPAGTTELASGESGGAGGRRVVENGPYGGFLIEVLQELSLVMGFSYTISPGLPHNPDDTAEGQAARGQLQSGGLDLILADLSSAPSHQDQRVYFSVPFHISYHSGLVLKTKKAFSLFRFLDPFTGGLYALLFATVAFTAVMLNVIDTVWPIDPDRIGKAYSLKEQISLFGKGIYHMTAIVLGGEEYEWIGWPLKILRTGLLLVVLIANATYTANLAAFLTVPSIKIHGPSTMSELGTSKVCAIHELYGGSVVMATEEEISYTASGAVDIAERKAWVNEKLDSKECDVWMHDVTVLQNDYLANCADRELAAFINVMPILYGLAGVDRALVTNISTGLMWLSALPEMADLKRDAFGAGETCSNEAVDTPPINAEQMSGVFIIFAGLAGLSLLVAVLMRCRHIATGGTGGDDEVDHMASDGEILRALLGKVDELLDSDATTKERLARLEGAAPKDKEPSSIAGGANGDGKNEGPRLRPAAVAAVEVGKV